MDAKDIKAIVDDFSQWRGNSYALAALVADAQKEADAAIAEFMEQPVVAEAIRGQ
jgi:hypothetical protein